MDAAIETTEDRYLSACGALIIAGEWIAGREPDLSAQDIYDMIVKELRIESDTQVPDLHTENRKLLNRAETAEMDARLAGEEIARLTQQLAAVTDELELARKQQLEAQAFELHAAKTKLDDQVRLHAVMTADMMTEFMQSAAQQECEELRTYNTGLGIERDALRTENTRLVEALESIDDADTLDIAQALALSARYAKLDGPQ